MFILCAKCNKEVDGYSGFSDPFTLDVHLIVYCHGDMDLSIVTQKFLQDAGRLITDGVAFKTPRLDIGEPPSSRVVGVVVPEADRAAISAATPAPRGRP